MANTLPFADEHKANTGLSDFPRLKLEKDERKRILCLEDPTVAYVHELRAPKIVDGKPHMVTIERGGSKITDYEKDFIGRPLCLGDWGTLLDKGVDPQNCPACKRSTMTDEIDRPKRRFALPVVVYATKPGSFDLRTPFSCELVVWSFTDRHYNKLVDIVKEWGQDGKIRNHDLQLGPCTNQAFQQYEINVASTAAWSQSEDRAKHVMETYNDNKPNDLEQFCGRKIQREWMVADIEKVRERWAIAHGKSIAERDDRGDEGKQLVDGLDELLNAGALSSTKPGDQVDVKGLDVAPPAKVEEPKEQPKPAEAIDFNSLLNSLG